MAKATTQLSLLQHNINTQRRIQTVLSEHARRSVSSMYCIGMYAAEDAQSIRDASLWKINRCDFKTSCTMTKTARRCALRTAFKSIQLERHITPLKPKHLNYQIKKKLILIPGSKLSGMQIGRKLSKMSYISLTVLKNWKITWTMMRIPHVTHSPNA